MLTRNAEGLYWLGRHVERAENGCRLLGEQVAALDLLVGDPRLPRSLRRTLDEAAGTLESIAPGPGPCAEARRLARDLARGVHQSWPAEAGLEPRVERMRRSDAECRRLHDAAMAAHVDYDPAG